MLSLSLSPSHLYTVLDAEHIRESDDPFYNVPSSSSGDGEEREYILVDESKRKRKRKKTPGEGDEQSQIIEITKKEAPAISVHAHCYPDWCAYYQPIFEQSPYSLGFQQPDENGRYSWSFALETASKMVQPPSFTYPPSPFLLPPRFLFNNPGYESLAQLVQKSPFILDSSHLPHYHRPSSSLSIFLLRYTFSVVRLRREQPASIAHSSGYPCLLPHRFCIISYASLPFFFCSFPPLKYLAGYVVCLISPFNLSIRFLGMKNSGHCNWKL